ncbi:MAG: ATP-binding protein [Caldilineaceae bacterium]
MSPPDEANKQSASQPQRRRYHETPLEERIDRSHEAEHVLELLQKTVAASADEKGRSRSKRLLLIEGDAGIGKTWFMEYLQERIRTQYPTWYIAPFYELANHNPQENGPAAYAAEHFIALDKNPYARFLEVLQRCDRLLQINGFGELPNPTPCTVEHAAEWAGILEAVLAERSNTPLMLFFDDLEWWVGVEGPQRDLLNHLFRIVWQMLLRQAQLPCIIIGASRRPPTFSNPMLRLTSTTYKLKGVETTQLAKLMPDSHWRQLQTYLDQNFDGNPWICQLLTALLSTQPDAWQNGKLSLPARQLVFERVVDGRLTPDLSSTLYQLAEARPLGFEPEDELLPQAHTTLKKLIDASFVDFDEATRRYLVAPVLSGLF